MTKLVLVGNATKDILPGGALVQGGAVSYGAQTAHELGFAASVITRFSPNDCYFPIGTDVLNIASPGTTLFKNNYSADGKRSQQMIEFAGALETNHQIPSRFFESDGVLFAPVFNEVTPGLIDQFRERDGAILGIAPQGLFRSRDSAGNIAFRNLKNPADYLSGMQVIFFSEEDIPGGVNGARFYTQFAPVVVVTTGANGCQVFYDGHQIHARAAYVSNPIDLTGAGDVFATAFMLYYTARPDPYHAARFANAVAAQSIQFLGTQFTLTENLCEEIHSL